MYINKMRRPFLLDKYINIWGWWSWHTLKKVIHPQSRIRAFRCPSNCILYEGHMIYCIWYDILDQFHWYFSWHYRGQQDQTKSLIACPQQVAAWSSIPVQSHQRGEVFSGLVWCWYPHHRPHPLPEWSASGPKHHWSQCSQREPGHGPTAVPPVMSGSVVNGLWMKTMLRAHLCKFGNKWVANQGDGSLLTQTCKILAWIRFQTISTYIYINSVRNGATKLQMLRSKSKMNYMGDAWMHAVYMYDWLFFGFTKIEMLRCESKMNYSLEDRMGMCMCPLIQLLK